MIGSRIVDEAHARGHEVIAMVRKPDAIAARGGVTVVAGDATNADAIAHAVAGADVVVDAFGPGSDQPQDSLSANARALVAGLPAAGVTRLMVVGGAGSLEAAPGVLVVDTPTFPAAVKPRATAQKAQLDIIRGELPASVTWTNVSPSAVIAPGERTGTFRVGGPQLLVDATGASRISAEDFAVAILNEIEAPQHPNQHITVGY
jgi:putative NADH-flavin reductase